LLRRTAPLLAGVLGWDQSTRTAVWPELIVILSPGFDQMARFGEPEEKCSFRHSSRSLRLKLIWIRPERKVVNRRMRIRLQSYIRP